MSVIDAYAGLKMPARDGRAALMVPDSADVLKRYYLVQRELVLAQAGWLPGVEHWGSKILIPELLWQDQLTAKELRERVLELRYPERRIAPGDDAPLLELWQRFRDAPNGLAFVEGLRQVLKPALRDAYQGYLGVADHLDDGPTVRILSQAIEDIDGQLERWAEALKDAAEACPDDMQTAAKWVKGLRSIEKDLRRLLSATRDSHAVPAFDPAAHGGKPFAISRTGKRDRRFNPILFGWPDSLDPSRGPGEGFQLQIRQASHHVNEIWAAEMAAACIFDLADQAPPEFLDDAARWCYDEIRHCRMGYTRLRNWGFKMNEMPMGSFSYDAGAEVDAVTRLGIIFYFESTYIHTKSLRMKLFGEFGDKVSSHDMDFDWADEQIHAHYGTRWLKYFLDQTNDVRKPIDFRAQSEACIKRMRDNATAKDREDTERLFQQTMKRAKELALASGQAS